MKKVDNRVVTTGIDISNLGFKSAFKATLGYHMANFVAFLLGLAVLGTVAAVVIGGIYLIVR